MNQHHFQQQVLVLPISAIMNYTISCLCGASHQEVMSDRPHLLLSDAEMDRHASGVLFVSHLTINPPGHRILSKLSSHESEDGKRFFCGTCGCHIFQKFVISPALASLAQKLGDVQRPTELFAVATGVISEGPEKQDITEFGRAPKDDTCDGGLVSWMPLAEMKGRTQRTETEAPPKFTCSSVPATCGCGNVKLLIQRPQELLGIGDKSQKPVQLPWSPYPDLMFPYKTTPKDKLDNPSDEKWFLTKTGEESKYLAGTCACKSCRLITGYEIQTWAFIPRVAISILISPDSATAGSASNNSAKNTTQNAGSYIPLDFEVLGNLPAGRNPLRSYESSPGVLREFCHGCGATVFWHSKVRPDLIDVSVGLLQAGEGARAESLLEWWRERCSFAEDADLDRKGWVKDWAEGLIRGLEEGMKR